MIGTPENVKTVPVADRSDLGRVQSEASPQAPPQNTMAPVPDETARQSHRRAGRQILGIGVVGVILLAGALVVGTLPRLAREAEVKASAEATVTAAPRVTVILARKGSAEAKQVLPGSALPLLEAALYARTNGYIQSRLVDIGDWVKQGQLLAVIATPEIDAQLETARATLLQSRATLLKDQANEILAKLDLVRVEVLLKKGAISKQEYDTNVAKAEATTATVKADEATIKANQANVVRLEALQAFEKVTAPFDGVITARNIDAGDLVTSDSPSTTREMFHLMRVDTLRVFVAVPQVFATDVQVGQTAVVYRKENPLKEFQGKVTRTANALDPNTRTLLTQVDVPNPKKELLPGMYLQVRFHFQAETVPVVIPTAALVTRSKGASVAVLDDQHRVQYRAVKLGRDFGTEIEIIAGLNAGESVVLHPGDDFPEGKVVQPVVSSKR